MVGNDVVDLADPEVRGGPGHPRFDARVFSRAERCAIGASGVPNRLRWMLWAAKEAAYKLARKRDPLVIFSPRRFVVRLDASLHGEVSWDGGRCAVSLGVEGDAVHAVATDGDALRLTSAVASAGATLDASDAARALAVRRLARRLDARPETLRIGRRGRIPTLEIGGVPAGVDLSLSHHGRFVAFACDLGGAAR
jgi:hypothetical protein